MGKDPSNFELLEQVRLSRRGKSRIQGSLRGGAVVWMVNVSLIGKNNRWVSADDHFRFNRRISRTSFRRNS